ncbi:[FeFe] hydrogenase H-cluster radical SAM maturase HydE [Acutalibacter sp. JLR.KK004]|uniref:[FeFe] hydrogenase H-cluster radical SAM maturase HydE n=1 Tax=Acutalibacter sp. JLR.KK004 TaxID=3112622 RepID=UPI002FF39004
MTADLSSLANRLVKGRELSIEEYAFFIENRTPELAQELAWQAVEVRQGIYGKDVYVRGLIEISNICKNDCLYCGIRASNKNCQRYRLTPEEIRECAAEGYRLGFRTFVLQGGEDAYYTDALLCALIRELKEKYPDCAITLSLGERSYESYKALKEAGADRYLLRHETADKAHYESLHPVEMSFENRMECLKSLRELGYQVGCGFMVGSPGQTARTLAKDLKFIEEFKPDMCGIGPFVPHADTVFAKEPAGTVELTCFLLSIIRLLHPPVLLPATTALGTIHPEGREMGILSGANVVMPNLSPVSVRKKYALYDNKICTGEESAQCKDCLSARMRSIGYEIVTDRGDVKKDGRHGRV